MPVKGSVGLPTEPACFCGREPTVRLRSPLAWNHVRNLGKGVTRVSLLWIILIVVLVLLLLGFFSRGRW